jgi:hypothetical protein
MPVPKQEKKPGAKHAACRAHPTYVRRLSQGYSTRWAAAAAAVS